MLNNTEGRRVHRSTCVTWSRRCTQKCDGHTGEKKTEMNRQTDDEEAIPVCLLAYADYT